MGAQSSTLNDYDIVFEASNILDLRDKVSDTINNFFYIPHIHQGWPVHVSNKILNRKTDTINNEEIKSKINRVRYYYNFPIFFIDMYTILIGTQRGGNQKGDCGDAWFI